MLSLGQQFVFPVPQGQVSAPAFSYVFKLIATAVVLAACAWVGQLWFMSILSLSWQSSGWILAAISMMGYTLWHILCGRTQIDAQAISQSWMWAKRMDLSELVYVKLLRVRGLEWLVAPRLYTRSSSGRFAVFYTADSTLLAVFAQLESDVGTARNTSRQESRSSYQ